MRCVQECVRDSACARVRARECVRVYESVCACVCFWEFDVLYMELRREHHSPGGDGTPITTRQLEALIRLAEARAKLELREVVTADDACDAVEVMKESLYDVFSDAHGQLDFRRGSAGSGMSMGGGGSKSAQVSGFMRALHRRSQHLQTSVFSTQELYKLACDIGLHAPSFSAFLESLNQQNFILQKGGQKWQLQSSAFT